MTHAPWPAPTLATLHDVARCLALIEYDALTPLPGGGLSRAGWQRLRPYISGALSQGRLRAEPDAPTSSWLFRTIGAGGLIGQVAGHLKLARAAYDWLAASPAEQVAALRQLWLAAPETACAWLPRTPHHGPRGAVWAALTRQLVVTVAALPVDTWVLTADLLADLAEQAVALDAGVARNLPSVRQAFMRQAALLTTFLLTEVLPRLGLLVMQGENADQCLALTAEGAAWLQQTVRAGKGTPGRPIAADDASPAADSAALEAAGWQLTDDLRLLIPLAAPAAATFEALRFADLLALGPPAEYRLSAVSLERGISHGYEVSDIRFLLAHGAGQPLPGPAAAQLARWQEELTLIRCEPGYRLRPAAPTALPALRSRAPFRAAAELNASGSAAFVGRMDAAALFRYLRRAGYVLQPVEPEHDSAVEPSALPPFLHRRLPLIPLATLVGLYGRLRASVSGLADLGLADLEQTLLAALPPPDRAAVARLIASNAALLGAQTGLPVAEPVAERPAAAASGEGRLARPSGAADIMEVLAAAITAGTALEILYADSAGAVTQRRIHPCRLEERWGRPYVVAYCELRGDERSFRVDRIVEAI